MKRSLQVRIYIFTHMGPGSCCIWGPECFRGGPRSVKGGHYKASQWVVKCPFSLSTFKHNAIEVPTREKPLCNRMTG